MILTFNGIIDLIANNFFGGSSTLAGLAILVVVWGVCAIIVMNMKAPPAYSIVPMIPIAIFFAAYGVLNETITLMIVIVAAALVAAEMKKAAD